MFHEMRLPWPCLSFDFVPDMLGVMRTEFPMSMTVLAGTQSDNEENFVYLMNWSPIHKVLEDEDSDEDESAGEQSPELRAQRVNHRSSVNRIRCCPQIPHLAASWGQDGGIYMWNLEKDLAALQTPDEKVFCTGPCQSYQNATEGYALAFSPNLSGHLLSGSIDGQILSHIPQPGGWASPVSLAPAHTQSVEDLDFSSTVANVFASCSMDASFALWDVRQNQACHRQLEAHGNQADLNVLKWSPLVPHLLLTCSDDGSFRCWDVRQLDGALASFSHHTQPLTSCSWHPKDEAVLAVSCQDGQLTMWDLSVEGDHDEEDIPPQLLFNHTSLDDPKEIGFHPQLDGVIVATDAQGFDLFKTENI